jgi:hypothetical protein
MSLQNRAKNVIQHSNLRHFFQDSVNQAIKNQRVHAEESTAVYLANLLTCFSRSENLFETGADGPQLRPLASFYSEAVNAVSGHERSIALQRLGDVALFIAGMFSQSLRRKPVDIDYYINMGGNAYGYLANIQQRKLNGTALGDIFLELSGKFVSFVDVLGEVGESLHSSTNTDLLRLYEIWLRTGSKRTRDQLLKHGLQLSADAGSLRRH